MLKCMICGKETTQINYAHLKMHGITSRQYKEMFPECKMREISEKAKEMARQNIIKRNQSEEGRKKSSELIKERLKTDEYKQTLKEAKAKEDKELRAKINGDNRRGKPHTKEAIEKISNNSRVKNPYGFKSGIREDLGHFVRSSWEANYARILKYLNIEYDFEPEIIWLEREDGTEISYRPDFKIGDLYIEVKGFWYKDAKEKFELLKKQYPNLKIKIINTDVYNRLQNVYKNKIKDWE